MGTAPISMSLVSGHNTPQEEQQEQGTAPKWDCVALVPQLYEHCNKSKKKRDISRCFRLHLGLRLMSGITQDNNTNPKL